MTAPQLIEFIIFLILAGFFNGSTIAFLHINKFSMEIKRKNGLPSGRILAYFTEQPLRYIASGAIGYLASIVIFSIFLHHALAPYWERIPFSTINPIFLEVLVQLFIAGILVLLFTLIPRSLFRAQANRLLPVFAIPISFFSKLLYPIASLMTGLSNWMLQYLFNVNITHNGIPYDLANKGSSVLIADKDEKDIKKLNTLFFENALTLPQVKIRNCMIPRKEIESLKLDAGMEELKQKFVETQHSKIIIYRDNIDDIIGYVHQLDLFKNPGGIKEILYPIDAVPETMNVVSLLTQMANEHNSITWVIDEYGGTAGIITIKDLLGEIFGDISEEHTLREQIELQIAEKEFLFSGRLKINYLQEKYGFCFGKNCSETLSGYIISRHESIPKERDRFIIGDFEFDITRVSETRIELVKLRLLT